MQPNKRARNLEWKVTFDQVQTLQKLVDIVEKVLTSITLRVSKTDSGGRMHIDSIDQKKACMVQARIDVMKFHVDPSRECDSISFSVRSKPLLTCLMSSPSHFSVDMMQYVGSTSVYVRSYDSLSNSHVFEAEIKTIVDESETFELADLQYKYEVQMDLSILRGIVKSAHALNSCDIRMQVFEPNPGSSNRLTAFRVSAEGGDDAVPANIFISELDSETNVIRTEESVQTEIELCDMLVQYDERFSVNYMHSFMKSMERQNLSMKISPSSNDSPALPLVIEYPLGKSENFIKFVLAARQHSE